MNLELAVIAILAALAVGGFVGHWIGINPGAVKAAETNASQEWKSAVAGLIAREGAGVAFAHQKIDALGAFVREEAAKVKSTATAAPSAEATASAAAAQATPAPAAPAWTLGDSYSSLGALAADIARPDFTRQVRVDGAPVFNVSGDDAIDFYTIGDALTQTKPA